MSKHLRSRKAAIAVFIAIIAVVFLARSYFPEEYVHRLVLSYGPLAPIVFILITLGVNIFFPLFAPPIVYAGYYAFGRDVVWYVSLSSLLCFVTNFWIARWWGRGLVERYVGTEAMKKIDNLSERYGIFTLFFLRVFQGGIHDLISYMGGLTKMAFVPYFVISLLGLLPGTLLWYIISLYSKDSVEFFALSSAVSIVTAGIFFVGTFVWNRIQIPKTRRKR